MIPLLVFLGEPIAVGLSAILGGSGTVGACLVVERLWTNRKKKKAQQKAAKPAKAKKRRKVETVNKMLRSVERDTARIKRARRKQKEIATKLKEQLSTNEPASADSSDQH